MKKTVFCLLLVFVSTVQVAIAADDAAATIDVQHAIIRLVPPGSTVTATFMDITSSQDDSIVSAYSPIAKKAELHTADVRDGKMKMRMVEAIDLPAKQMVQLKSGGYHIMLIGVNVELRENQLYPVIINLSSGRQVQVDAVVTKAGAEARSHNHSH